VNRIAVIGAGGAGKTRLARTLGRVLDLPVVHLDAHYYNPGWQPLPPAEWAARQHQLAAGTRWVMDGNYASTLALRLERADTIILLDLHPLLCAWQVLWRWTLGHLRSASDLPAGLRPKLGRQFLAYVLGFRRHRRPALLAELARWSQGRTVVILRSRRAVKQFIARLPSA
jgi:adenylate kinase family enzyme